MKKIIVVDDSRAFRIQVRTRLEDEGFEVLEAEDGNTGYELIKENQDVKLILSDINMSGMDGISMLEELKSNDLLLNIGVIVLTTETSAKLQARRKKSGVDAWFSKPLSIDRWEILVRLVYKLIKKFENETS